MKLPFPLVKSPGRFTAATAAAVSILAVFAVTGKAFAEEKYALQEVPLAVEHKHVQYETILPKFVEKIISTPRYAAFISSRQVWIKFPKKKPVPLSSLVKLPQGFDWYQIAYAIGDRLIISVGSYSEERRQKDIKTPRGGYVEGPRAVGMILVRLKPAEAVLVTSIKTVSKPPVSGETSSSGDITPKFQSCFWDGKNLYLGEYGYLARVNLESMTADILEFDSEMQINRASIFKEGSALWYAADEGGAGGSWITKLDVSGTMPKAVSEYALLNDGFTLPDSILRYESRLLTSSLAGVVEIDETKKTFIHFQMTKDPKAMRVYKLGIINGQLWGLREDGWVRFDLNEKKAIHYHLQGDGVSNNIYSIGFFEGQWYIGTDTEVVQVK